MKRRLIDLLWRVAVRYERELRIARTGLIRLLALTSRLLRALPSTSWRFGPPRRYTFDSADWAGSERAVSRPVDPTWVTDRLVVEARGQVLPHQFTDSLRWSMPPTFVLSLGDARLWGPDATAVTADDTVLADQTNAFRLGPEELPIMRQLRLGRPEHVPGTTATICGAYAQSYYHWMFDLLPRLDILQRSGLPFDRLVAPHNLAFHRETLAAAGIDRHAVLPHTPRTYLHLDRLLFPSVPGTPGQSPPAVTAYLRGLFPDDVVGRSQHRRLFLSRADTNRRKLANEAAVIAALDPFGFETITLSGRSVAEQVRLFAAAEVIVAPHGGALTNLVFCQPGTKVVELFPPGYTPVCFWTITAELGLDYRPVFDDHRGPHDGAAQWVPYTVTPARVLEMLEDLDVRPSG